MLAGPLVIEKPVSRLEFGRVLFCPAHEGRWLFAHSAEPYGHSGLNHHVRLDKGNLQALERFHASNLSFSLEIGPYADRAGLAGGLAERLSERVSSDDELLVRAISFIRDAGFFAFDRSFIPDEGLFSAGSVLSNPERVCPHSGSEGLPIRFAHEMEPYLLASAILRRAGMHAYPALAISHLQGVKEEAEPVMAVHFPGGMVPLKTFSLSGTHPPMCGLELLGDMASIGLTHSMRAEHLARRISTGILAQSLQGSTYPPEAIEAEVADFSGELFKCHSHWPDSAFIPRAIERLGDETGQALRLAAARVFAGSSRMALMAAWADLLSEGLQDMARRFLEDLKRSSAERAH